MEYPRVFAAMFTVATITLWPLLSEGQPAQDVGNLTKSSVCSISRFSFQAGATSKPVMTVKNDGGWCWANLYFQSMGFYSTAHDFVIIIPPQHGHLLVGDLKNYRVQIAFQPDPGFIGSDTFTTGINVADVRLIWEVTVTQ